ncbi:integrin alpha-2 [Poeciliopsis prolifica]|uniref:integrin alpha-2 n=1 Tax=Poeciliopsis prolifica TaxID=188132 RepID=UPI00241329EC|nr:integrin alpha-2 [Poeciliopsis prolifica]
MIVMDHVWRKVFFAVIVISDKISQSQSFNVGTAGAKIFLGPASDEFGYTVQQALNYQDKWLLVGAPWSDNRKGDLYKCSVLGSINKCDKLNLQDSVRIRDVTGVNANMSLGLTLAPNNTGHDFLMCGPLWGQQCGDQNFYPGICAKLNPVFQPQPAFSPAIQTCTGMMDIVIVLDGSNSIYPWPPMTEFLRKLIPSLDIGPQSTQMSVIQYSDSQKVEFKLNRYTDRSQMLDAASRITQMYGTSTNTFEAISFASKEAFSASNGGRPEAAKVLVVVTDGESHDSFKRDSIIAECDKQGIIRFGIAVLGYYTRNNIDTKNLIQEIKSIASQPTEKYFFNVSEEAALSTIAATLGKRIFNIEGTGKGEDSFKMEMSQVGFSAYYSKQQDMMMLGAVGAYAWSGTVVHQKGSVATIFPFSAFEGTLQERNHSSLLGYALTTLTDGSTEYFVAGAPRANHSGQVIIYTVNPQKQPVVVDTERGKQIGSYFGSVLCSLDVDDDKMTDLLLVGAPMYMNEAKKEQGRVYLFSVTKGILNEQGFLNGASGNENARFGMAISVIPDLDLNGFSDVVVGAPMEDKGKGVIYIYNGYNKGLMKDFSQRILGSKLNPQLQFFGRSLDSTKDLNGDNIPDISIGAYGSVVQLWSRGVAVVTAKASFKPDKISILNKDCDISGRKLSCFTVTICFSASFRPTNPVGPIDVFYTLTLDADLKGSRVTSRGLFEVNNERFLKEKIKISSTSLCVDRRVHVQETPDLVNSLSLKVEVEQENPDVNPVLDSFSPKAFEFFIPFTKDCGSDELCVNDLELNVNRQGSSSSPVLFSANNRELKFKVVVKNKNENAYNTQVSATFSNNLFYSSVTATDEVKCTPTLINTVTCQVGYAVLKKDQEVNFEITFDYSFDSQENQASVNFEARSDGKEENPADNTVQISIPVQFDTGVVLSTESNINFYVADSTNQVITTVKTLEDIGPEFTFTVKVSTGIFPLSLLFLTISLPVKTKGENPLLYLTSVEPQAGGSISCSFSPKNPPQVGEQTQTVSFREENLKGTKRLDCTSAKCEKIECILKDTEIKSDYLVKVKTRIWNGTFITASYQSIDLISSLDMKTPKPDLLIVQHKHLDVVLPVSKPGEKADVPVGVIVGSAIGGLVLLALAVGLLYKFGFFKRKYQQLQKEDDEDRQNPAQDDGVL